MIKINNFKEDKGLHLDKYESRKIKDEPEKK